MHWVAISSVVRWSLFAAVILLFVREPGQVWMVPLTELGAIGCVVILNLGVFSYSFGRLWKRFDITFAVSLLRQAVPIGMTQVMWGLKIYLPTVMLGLLIGGEQVGWFGSAHRIVLALHAFVWMYYFNLYPSISRCSQQTPETLQMLAGKSIQLNSWAAVFVGVTGTIFANPLMYYVYGQQYTEAATGFQVLIWLISFALISGHYMYILIAYNKQWLELLSAILGAIVSIILNLTLISKFGFVGAAWAVLCSELFIWGLNYFFVRREITVIRFAPHLIKPVAAGAIMVAVLRILPSNNLWLSCGVAILLYTAGLFILQPSMISDARSLLSGSR
jgi:O-antigen/teichoic acid export membrane protein